MNGEMGKGWRLERERGLRGGGRGGGEWKGSRERN